MMAVALLGDVHCDGELCTPDPLSTRLLVKELDMYLPPRIASSAGNAGDDSVLQKTA